MVLLNLSNFLSTFLVLHDIFFDSLNLIKKAPKRKTEKSGKEYSRTPQWSSDSVLEIKSEETCLLEGKSEKSTKLLFMSNKNYLNFTINKRKNVQ